MKLIAAIRPFQISIERRTLTKRNYVHLHEKEERKQEQKHKNTKNQKLVWYEFGIAKGTPFEAQLLLVEKNGKQHPSPAHIATRRNI